ncbi:hypothetical protein N7453_001426 [Penicillium expansum]|nr:hypothetical protein N7453_001426 [Penicillium expansum]
MSPIPRSWRVVAKWHGQPAEHTDGRLYTILPAPGRWYNVLISRGVVVVPMACSAGWPCRWPFLFHVASSWDELAVAEGGMVSLLNTQVAAFVPYCQPLGDDIMLASPRGWRLVCELACSAG